MRLLNVSYERAKSAFDLERTSLSGLFDVFRQEQSLKKKKFLFLLPCLWLESSTFLCCPAPRASGWIHGFGLKLRCAGELVPCTAGTRAMECGMQMAASSPCAARTREGSCGTYTRRQFLMIDVFLFFA